MIVCLFTQLAQKLIYFFYIITAKQGDANKSRKLIIGLSVVGLAALCLGVYCLCYWNRFRKGNFKQLLNARIRM